ncbi:indolepyruvate oxidoreductase subunit beta family protein [Variovorax sp. Root411]|uniref:indolepyruvate oxidoreductase subunit beta family protein n=1 Tax=Variovorax sp. Root411 TaxID=1736530 RepID=UPI0006F5190F|nr:indolepyruvate oxidoreductase subunit beta family protein [Variovorax sp. Root411]KQW64943.1 indolepyruvate oxidoreductase subunit B [Variovorax sp. Root411]
MNTTTPAGATPRIVTVLVAAMGGEGGGVLADWLISAATACGFPVQSTSVPGVAQRTGATNYYVEIYPVPAEQLGNARPVFSLTPNPGDVDIVAASELVEAGRMLQGGFVHPRRTTLAASTHREYAVVEKSAMGDGRYDGQRVIDAATELAQRSFLFDMRALAWRNGTVINTVMFGAMAGSGAIPFSRETCEQAIRASGKAVEASLKGFAAGFNHVTGVAAVVGAAPPAATTSPAAAPVHPRIAALPEPLRHLLGHGLRQVADYQDARYGDLYMQRVESVLALEQPFGGDLPVTRETARYLALWMSYEDVVRVADLKTRGERLQRVRNEVGARGNEPLRLTEYLKPGLDEVCSLLPPTASAWLRKRLAHKAHKLNVGLHMRTDTVFGFAMLCGLRSLRVMRRASARYAIEQQMIDRWLDTVRRAIAMSPRLAYEIALCGNLVKGYGETSERGHRNLGAVLDDMQAALAAPHPGAASIDQAAARVRAAREAALSDPEGRTLARALGLPAPAARTHPIHIVRRKPAR